MIELHDLEQTGPDVFIHTTGGQLREHIKERTLAALGKGRAEKVAITTPDASEKRKRMIREALINGLGGLPSDTPLNARVTGVDDYDGYRVEKIIFESRPNVYVTGNMYIPEPLAAPTGAVLFVCGHHDAGKHADEYQMVCQVLTRAGLVVFAQDPTGQGERLNYAESFTERCVLDHDMAGMQCWMTGHGLARYFVHDSMRAVDYLLTRGEVDPNRIGITGNSGGGTQSSLMMMCDARLAAAAPATFIMDVISWLGTGGAQDSEQIWPGLVSRGFDHDDIIAGMCPKPVLILAVDYDFFPLEGVKRTYDSAKRLYALHGKADNLEFFSDRCDHHYTFDMAEKAAAFFSKHLLNRAYVHIDKNSIKTVEHCRLWATESGRARGEITGALSPHDENVRILRGLDEAKHKLTDDERREAAFIWIKEKADFARVKCDINHRPFGADNYYDIDAQTLMWFSQENIINYGVLFKHISQKNRKTPVTAAFWENGTKRLQAHAEWVRKTTEAGRAVLVADVTGVGNLTPDPLRKVHTQPEAWLSTMHNFSHNLYVLNDNLAAMRAYDAARVAELIGLLDGVDASETEMYVEGRQASYALLAAFVCPAYKKVTLGTPPYAFGDLARSRYYDAYGLAAAFIPGMLRYYDMPDIARWLEADGRLVK